MQAFRRQPHRQWKSDGKQNSGLLTLTTFWTLNADYKFLLICTINKTYRLLMVEGRLIYNNGATVQLSTSHQCFVKRFLNHKDDPIRKKLTFGVSQAIEGLTFTAKINEVNDLEVANRNVKLCEDELLLRKKSITCILAIIGIPVDCENALMRKILIHKKNLKSRLVQILSNKGSHSQIMAEEKRSEDEGGLFFFGEGGDYVLVERMEEEKESANAKRSEGGYFSIGQVPHRIQDRSGTVISGNLVSKILRQKWRSNSFNSSNEVKVRKQLEIVNNIKNKRHIIRYYCNRANLNVIYMDRYEHSLQQYIYYLGDSLEVADKINISRQLLEAIQDIHQSDVIHRDIKPANILLDDSKKDTEGFKVKLIDFSESYPAFSNNREYLAVDYGCSHPYSPLQCFERKSFTDKGPQEGLSRKEIDYWSVAITIYQIFYRRLPVSFSRGFLIDIASSWKAEFLVAVNQREKVGLNLVETMINILCVKMMKYSQEQRMNISLAKRIMQILGIYVQNLMKIAEDCI